MSSPTAALSRRFPSTVTKPDFLIIGAQKAGTSSLYAWLTQHPDVLAAREKELHYFDRRIRTEPIDRYWADFPSDASMSAARRRGRKVATGEATPAYLFDPSVPAAVHRHLPSARLVVVLRDPVERAISQYWMEFNRANETLSLEDAFDAEAERTENDFRRIERGEQPSRFFWTATYAARGYYADQLERWLGHFARSQLLILEFEDLVADPQSAYRVTLEFLGVDPRAAPPPNFTAERVGSKQPTDPQTLARLRLRFVDSNRRLAELVGIDYNTTSRPRTRRSADTI